MSPTKKRSVLALVFVLGSVVPSAHAGCPNTVETDEQALWNVHSCWPAFRDWFRPYFNLQQDHWDGIWGWGTCDPTQEFPKMWNSSYLITYGLEQWPSGPWHSETDYYRWAAGSQHGFRFEPEDAGGAYAEAIWGLLTPDRVEMRCPSFNSRTAGARAGTMLHESTHHQYKDLAHMANAPGSNCSEPCSDDWFFHHADAYPYGSLAGHKHSPVQIQIEFLCDLAEFGEWWVPAGIASAARSEANDRMINRIRNPPGWTCGQPRPLLPSGANPLTYSRARDQYLSCWGIAGQISSNCDDVSDVNDRQMCRALSTRTQSPCATLTDRNLQLACYGMSVAPSYPSNCRDITDPGMRDFCYSVASYGSQGSCSGVANPSEKALCQALTYRNASYCNGIGNANDRWFCSGVASGVNSYCGNIVQ
jgi:hypothetical protein